MSAFFETVLGGDGAFPRKPDPAGLLHLVAKYGVDARETVLVGDSRIDFETARAAGTDICLARYGFASRRCRCRRGTWRRWRAPSCVR